MGTDIVVFITNTPLLREIDLKITTFWPQMMLRLGKLKLFEFNTKF